MKTTTLLFGSALVGLLAACAKPTARTSAPCGPWQLRRTLSWAQWRTRSGLCRPAQWLELQDVSKPGAPAAVVAEKTVLTRSQAGPLAFSLPYDTLRIDPTNTYAVQARIEADGQLLYANAAACPVITRGNSKRLQMMLRPTR